MRPHRSWWQVPLWSPLHLLATCAVVLVVLFLAGRLQAASSPDPGGSPPATSDAAPPSPSSAGTTADPNPTRSSAAESEPEPDRSEDSEPKEPKKPVEVAEAFVEAWARRYDPPKEWRSAVTALSTPDFARLLEKTDPLHVPATRSLGHAEVLDKGNGTMRVRVSTDSGPVAVTVEKSSGRWLASGIEPINTGR